MFVLAAVAPGMAVRAASDVPRTLPPRTDLFATLVILIIGLVLVAGAIRSVCKK